MEAKDQLRFLLENIKKTTGKTQKVVAEEMGYKPTSISDMLGSKGEVSEKFITNLKLKYFGKSEPPTAHQELLYVPTGLTVKDYIDLQDRYLRYVEKMNEQTELLKVIAANSALVVGGIENISSQNHNAGNPGNTSKQVHQDSALDEQTKRTSRQASEILKRKKQQGI